MAKTKDDRARAWRFLLYPESCNPDFRRILENDYNVSGWVSPLHEPDSEEGIFKPHYHVILVFEGKKSYDQVLEIANAVGGVMYSGALRFKAKVEALRGAVRYLIHYDSAPDSGKQKWTQGKDSIIRLCGADPDCYFEMTQDDVDNALRDMRAIVRKLDITEYAELTNYCDLHQPTWAHMLNTRYSNVMHLYIKSRRHTDFENRDLDLLTGAYIDDE